MITYQSQEGKTEILEKIYKAYNTLLSKDIYLLKNNVNERSLTHKLAEYLQVEFLDWDVDCEYNKNIVDEKTVPVWKEKRNELLMELEKEITNRKRTLIEKVLDGGISVYPDIIIHHRGTSDNLVVIEAKKDNFSGDNYDLDKLKAYKNNLGYKFSFKITFPVDNTIDNGFDISNFIKEII